MRLRRGPVRRHIFPSGCESQGWTFMTERHGADIASIFSSELTGVTEVTLRDGTTDRLYVAADHIPLFRSEGPPD